MITDRRRLNPMIRDMADFFRLSHGCRAQSGLEMRWRIVSLLLEGPRTTLQLHKLLQEAGMVVAQPTVFYHISKLVEVGFVEPACEGIRKNNPYALAEKFHRCRKYFDIVFTFLAAGNT